MKEYKAEQFLHFMPPQNMINIYGKSRVVSVFILKMCFTPTWSKSFLSYVIVSAFQVWQRLILFPCFEWDWSEQSWFAY